MRLALRFLLPLLLAIGLTAYLVAPLVETLMVEWASNDLDTRTRIIGASVEKSLPVVLPEPSIVPARARGFFDELMQNERLYALGFCTPQQRLAYKSDKLPSGLDCPSPGTPRESATLPLPTGPVRIGYYALAASGVTLGQLILVHDMSFAFHRSADTQLYVMYFLAILGGIISIITVVIAQLSWRGWMSGIRALVRGENLLRPLGRNTSPELTPIARDLRALIRDLDAERGLRDDSHTRWSTHTLKELLKRELLGEEIIVVSNREPHIHEKTEDGIRVRMPPSGLVTALEPIMRACAGTWVAHGAGSADRETVDSHDRIQVPPKHPAYTLRRVWLTAEEEKGYYDGFSNEGLWPLCHIAHVRPVFRSEDFDKYMAVNEKFAKAVAEEATTENPIILVQDYLLAPLPRMLRKRLPKATIVTFWHIPWPNPEAFGICPWREQLLDGLLGSSIIGFHTRFHCNNFLDTVDRFLECRIDREHSTVSYKRSISAVQRYPISIEFPSRLLRHVASVPDARAAVRKRYGMPEDRALILGVDRLDYTKGIIEKCKAVERLLELRPEWRGRIHFIQIGAPTRSRVEQYRRFHADVVEEAKRVNEKFGSEGYEPILLRIEYCEPEEILEYYRGADVCFVASLHDGMNLVAKEFVAARDDEHGVLVLSQFTGASREFPEALLVNPYHADECAEALHTGLTMEEGEQRDRMRSMRGSLQEFNVYRWAGKMLMDAARIRRRNRFLERPPADSPPAA